MRVTLDFPAAEEILQEVGLDEQGDTQMFHTKNVLRRIQKYMPYRTGATIKLTVAQTDPRVPEIVTEEPQAVYPACTYAIAPSLLWITALYHKERIAVRISTHP